MFLNPQSGLIKAVIQENPHLDSVVRVRQPVSNVPHTEASKENNKTRVRHAVNIGSRGTRNDPAGNGDNTWGRHYLPQVFTRPNDYTRTTSNCS